MRKTEHFTSEDMEENRLVFPFDDGDECGYTIFSSPLLGKVSNKKLIDAFILEVQGGEQYEMYRKIDFIPESEAQMLLRQMAMFRIRRNKKERLYTPSEAKLAVGELMAFVGSRAEFYTNVLSVGLPHDNPGRIMSSDSEGTHNSVTLFVITDKYLIFIEQTWHD